MEAGRVRPRLVYVCGDVQEGPEQQGACTKVLENLRRLRREGWKLLAVRGIGQGGEIALIEAQAFGGTAKEKDAFGEEREGAEREDERGGGELGFRGREEPECRGADGENEVEDGAAGMVFEVTGEVFEEEFAERHAGSVAQKRAAGVGEVNSPLQEEGRSSRETDSQKWLSHWEQTM